MRNQLPAETEPLVVVWRVTERCDLACPFCAYDRGLRRTRREADPTEVVRFLGLVRAAWPDRDVLVSWLGGEPALWEPLADVTAAARALGLRASLTTNGRALRRAPWRAWAEANLAEITVSLDGVGPVHDALRADPGGYAAILEAIATLRGPLVRVNTVLQHDTLGGFGALVEELAEAGVQELTFNALGGNDRPAYFPAHRLTVGDVERIVAELPAIRERAARRGLVVRGGPGYLGRMRASAAGVALPIDDCGPGARFWFVESDGRVAPCHFTVGEYGVPISDLRVPADLHGLPGAFVAARSRRSSWCADCPSTQVHEKFEP